MTDLREEIADIVRDAIFAGYKDGLERNVSRPDPPAEHYADRIIRAIVDGMGRTALLRTLYEAAYGDER